ncbi:MAG: glycosyltransferase family 2 protein [Erysipelotrichales bacterium]|nr:glycosyltransferase family 2 protein [Erysipelotrichales bacterium]
MKTLIIIPAFNEAKNIPNLINKIAELNYDYLIINDCSTDNSAQLLDQKALNHLDLPINLGLASVTQMGFKYAADNDYDCAIVIDGDGQHPPFYINTVVQKISDGYDYAIGSRYVECRKPWTLRMIGSRIISLVIRLKTGQHVSDPTSGMRALGKKTLIEFSKNMNFIAEPDALTYILKKKLSVCEVQVSMVDRDEGNSYFENPIRTTKFMINVIMSILFM